MVFIIACSELMVNVFSSYLRTIVMVCLCKTATVYMSGQFLLTKILMLLNEL